MTPAIVEKKKYTYEDYLKTPDDKRYELIGGDLLVAPSPVPNHQRISRKIEFILEKPIINRFEIVWTKCAPSP